MDKAKASQILGHQLKGIMLHADLMKMALVEEHMGYARKHYCYTLAETKCHLLTCEHLIKKLGCNIEPTQQARIVVPDNATTEQMNEMWRTWENDTVAVYQEAYEEDHCDFWKKLYSKAKKELTSI